MEGTLYRVGLRRLAISREVWGGTMFGRQDSRYNNPRGRAVGTYSTIFCCWRWSQLNFNSDGGMYWNVAVSTEANK